MLPRFTVSRSDLTLRSEAAAMMTMETTMKSHYLADLAKYQCLSFLPSVLRCGIGVEEVATHLLEPSDGPVTAQSSSTRFSY